MPVIIKRGVARPPGMSEIRGPRPRFKRRGLPPVCRGIESVISADSPIIQSLINKQIFTGPPGKAVSLIPFIGVDRGQQTIPVFEPTNARSFSRGLSVADDAPLTDESRLGQRGVVELLEPCLAPIAAASDVPT